MHSQGNSTLKRAFAPQVGPVKARRLRDFRPSKDPMLKRRARCGVMHVKFSHGVDEYWYDLGDTSRATFDIAQQRSFPCLRFHTDIAKPHDHCTPTLWIWQGWARMA